MYAIAIVIFDHVCYNVLIKYYTQGGGGFADFSILFCMWSFGVPPGNFFNLLSRVGRLLTLGKGQFELNNG